MNSVVLAGNLTKDPELCTTANGIEYTAFTVACQQNYKNQEGAYGADFIRCVAWRQTAAFISKHFRKGERIVLDGRISVRSFDDRNGQRQYITEVVVNNAEFGGGDRRNDSQQRRVPPIESGEVNYGSDLDTDFEPLQNAELPF